MTRYSFGERHDDDEETFSPEQQINAVVKNLLVRQEALEQRLTRLSEAKQLLCEAVEISSMTDEETRTLAASAVRNLPVSDPLAYRHGQVYVRLTRALTLVDEVVG